MPYRLLADSMLLLHLAFILFVLGGGFLILRYPRMMWFHLPAVAWGITIEATGWVCPLTPLENRFRALAGQAPYQESFIEHYLLPLIYPTALSRTDQYLLAAICLGLNSLIYLFVFNARLKRRKEDG